jgi:hypothetical protein
MDRETAQPKMIASRSCHRPKISPELIPKPNHGPHQPIKQKDNHRGWCVPQRTTVVVPQRTRIVAPTEDKGTDQQTRTNNPDQTNTKTKTIQYHSNLGRIPDHQQNTFKSRKNPRPLMTVSMIVITVVQSIEVCALYPRIVISSPFGD